MSAKPTPLVDRQAELEWLAEVLWGPTHGVELVVGDHSVDVSVLLGARPVEIVGERADAETRRIVDFARRQRLPYSLVVPDGRDEGRQKSGLLVRVEVGAEPEE